MSLRCSECDGPIAHCVCAVEHAERFPLASSLLDVDVSAADLAFVERMRLFVKSGAAVLVVAKGEVRDARESLWHHQMLARLAGDAAEASRIEAVVVEVRASADRRAA